MNVKKIVREEVIHRNREQGTRNMENGETVFLFPLLILNLRFDPTQN